MLRETDILMELISRDLMHSGSRVIYMKPLLATRLYTLYQLVLQSSRDTSHPSAALTESGEWNQYDVGLPTIIFLHFQLRPLAASA